MIRVTVLYPAGPGATFDHDYFATKHLKMVKERLGPLGVVSVQGEKGMSGATSDAPPPFLAVGQLVFNSLSDFQKAFGAHGQEIMGDIPNYTNVQPQIQISEVTVH